MKTILVCDDDPGILQVFKTILENEGYTPICFKDSPEAMSTLLKGYCPDLLLLDVQMPHITGVQMLRAIRKQHLCEGVPVILMSAWSERLLDLSGDVLIELGPVTRMAKPFDVSDFLDLVARLVHTEEIEA